MHLNMLLIATIPLLSIVMAVPIGVESSHSNLEHDTERGQHSTPFPEPDPQTISLRRSSVSSQQSSRFSSIFSDLTSMSSQETVVPSTVVPSTVAPSTVIPLRQLVRFSSQAEEYFRALGGTDQDKWEAKRWIACYVHSLISGVGPAHSAEIQNIDGYDISVFLYDQAERRLTGRQEPIVLVSPVRQENGVFHFNLEGRSVPPREIQFAARRAQLLKQEEQVWHRRVTRSILRRLGKT